MINILLVCDQGFSTSMMEAALKKEVAARNITANVEAVGVLALSKKVEDANVILLGPQIAYRKDELTRKYPVMSGKTYVMNPSDFAMMNSKKVLDDALKMIEK